MNYINKILTVIQILSGLAINNMRNVYFFAQSQVITDSQCHSDDNVTLLYGITISLLTIRNVRREHLRHFFVTYAKI